MLKFLRKEKVRKRIFIILALVIIPPFLLWGVIANQKEGKKPSLLGRIEGQNISAREYLASYKAVQHQVALMYGEHAKELASSINYKAEAWDRLLLVRYAKKENIRVSDKEVVQWLLEQPLFSRKGEFDSKFYKLHTNNYLKTEPREFEEEIRQLLSIGKIQERLKSKIHLSDKELEKLYDKKRRAGKSKFTLEKERFKETTLNRKANKAMNALIEDLRKKLDLNLETMKKIFSNE